MRKPLLLLLIVLLFTGKSFSQSCSAQGFIPTTNEEDIIEALKFLNIDIFKYSVTSNDTLRFNLLYQEFYEGVRTDSLLLMDNKVIEVFEKINHDKILITSDTNYLRIFCHKENDSSYFLKAGYARIGVGSYQKSITFSKAKLGRHILYSFGSPVIKKKGVYHVLMLNQPWMIKMGDFNCEKDCFPNSLTFIKGIIKHFYLISIVAY